jgi:2-iminobutanoate/2-iminopropanoate deaminase
MTKPTPVDPPEAHSSPAFAQGMIAPAGATLYVGGQNGTDATGTLLDGLHAQTEQALRNVMAVLAVTPARPGALVEIDAIAAVAS